MANVKTMTVSDRIAEVLTRSKKNFGPEIGRAIDSLLTKTNLAILAGTLTLWAGSHLFWRRRSHRRMNAMLAGIKFPVANGYVTVTNLYEPASLGGLGTLHRWLQF